MPFGGHAGFAGVAVYLPHFLMVGTARGALADWAIPRSRVARPHGGADPDTVMAPNSLECLGCGARRSVLSRVHSHLEAGECPRCGYVGWASPTDLTEFTRRALRDRPVERRSLRAAS